MSNAKQPAGQPHELTPDEAARLLGLAVANGQELLSVWAREGKLRMGEPIFVRLRWPVHHPREIYLFVGLDPDTPVHIAALSEPAGMRLRGFQTADNLMRWAAIQTWHEHAGFRLRTEIAPLRPQATSGLVLPN